MPIIAKAGVAITIALTAYILYREIKNAGYQKGVKSVEYKLEKAHEDCAKKLAEKDSMIIRLANIPKTQVNVKKIKDHGALLK